MKALVKQKAEPGIDLMDIPEPTASAGDVLIAVETVGICGSDLHMYHWPPTFAWAEPLLPMLMGHEIVGTVLSSPLESDVQKNDRVAVRPGVGCGICEECLFGSENLCAKRVRLGAHLPGGFAPILVAPVHNVHKVAPVITRDSAAILEPLAVVTHAISRITVPLGSRAAVVGAGAIGLLAAQVLRVDGTAEVSVVGLDRDGVSGSLDFARKNGCAGIVAGSAAANILNGTQDIVVCASGGVEAIATCLRLLRSDGTLLLIGLGTGTVPWDIDTSVRREIHVVGSFASVATDWIRALRLVESGRFTGDGLISHAFPLDEGKAAFQLLDSGGARKILIIPNG